ncbi:MAG TPA: hypothetical protein VMM18_05515 [Gemmatimonadaceae bacterium]|nr:hypothetical protein [Gemmatimonadaceae bacterium]
MPAFDGSIGSILVLGAVHGINPAMGWLFAVSLGLQAQSGRVVWVALGPLALGHALAVAATIAVAAALGVVVPLTWLRWLAAAALLAFGVMHLVRHRHPRAGGGMNVGAKDLTLWSFVVSSAHGAGLMVLPFVLGLPAAGASGHGAHAHGMAAVSNAAQLGEIGVLATLLHTASYLAVAGAIAWVVYARVGLRLLRSAWINVNLIWATALIVTAMVTPLM